MRRRILAGAVLIAAAAPAAWAASTWSINPQSTIRIEGTSTVRSFACEASKVGGSIATEAAASGTAIAQLQSAVKHAEITVATADLDCKNGTMNEHMRKALKAEANPVIRFKLQTLAVTPSGETQGAAKLDGTLSIAGQEKPVSIEGALSRDADGTVHVKGSKQIVMTEWGVQPPKLMMGTMKVNPNVKILFDVAVKQ